MSKLTEQDVILPFVGKKVNRTAFEEMARYNSYEYVICSSRYLDKPNFLKLFCITEKLKEHWEYSGVEFELHLSISDDIITNAHIDKYWESGGGHGRPSVHVLKETQQELRIARRILQFITV